jgi:hypothetical protein
MYNWNCNVFKFDQLANYAVHLVVLSWFKIDWRVFEKLFTLLVKFVLSDADVKHILVALIYWIIVVIGSILVFTLVFKSIVWQLIAIEISLVVKLSCSSVPKTCTFVSLRFKFNHSYVSLFFSFRLSGKSLNLFKLSSIHLSLFNISKFLKEGFRLFTSNFLKFKGCVLFFLLDFKDSHSF